MDLKDIEQRRDVLIKLDAKVIAAVENHANPIKLWKAYEWLAVTHYEDDLDWCIRRIATLEGMVKRLTTEFTLTHEQIKSAMECEDMPLKQELPLLREIDEGIIKEAQALVGATEE